MDADLAILPTPRELERCDTPAMAEQETDDFQPEARVRWLLIAQSHAPSYDPSDLPDPSDPPLPGRKKKTRGNLFPWPIHQHRYIDMQNDTKWVKLVLKNVTFCTNHTFLI